METGKLGVWYFTETMSAPAAAEAAQRIEALGYGTLWIPETTGRNPVAHAAWLLANTSTLNIATGIANIYHREPGVALAAQNTLAEQSGGRFLLGQGVSHAPLVEGVRGLEYGKPVATMRKYLEGMDAAPYTAFPPGEKPPRVIAALGPKMLELARDLSDGAHPYFTSPDHTRMAREILGPDKMLCVEQKVILETDPAKARARPRRRSDLHRPAELPEQLAAHGPDGRGSRGHRQRPLRRRNLRLGHGRPGAGAHPRTLRRRCKPRVHPASESEWRVRRSALGHSGSPEGHGLIDCGPGQLPRADPQFPSSARKNALRVANPPARSDQIGTAKSSRRGETLRGFFRVGLQLHQALDLRERTKVRVDRCQITTRPHLDEKFV